MGLFRKKKQEPKTISLTVTDLPSGWRLTAAGTSHRQEALEAALASAAPSPPEKLEGTRRFGKAGDQEAAGWIDAIIIREPDNTHDKNAVAIWSTDHGQLGYLPAKKAVEYQELLLELGSRNSAGTCPAYIRRNSSGGLSLVLCLSTAEYCVRNLDADEYDEEDEGDDWSPGD
jgi:hypothetical protein